MQSWRRKKWPDNSAIFSTFSNCTIFSLTILSVEHYSLKRHVTYINTLNSLIAILINVHTSCKITLIFQLPIS